MTAPLTRREILRDAAGAAVGLGALGVGPSLAAAAGKRERVAVIGAGMGGIAAAYFLGNDFDVDVYESRTRIGGHCDSRAVDVGGEKVIVDLAAQFFHPDTHPIYATLLEQLGLFDPANPNGLQTRESVGSLTIFPTDGGDPRFTSTRPLDDLPTAIAFGTFTQQARQAVIDELPWEVTVDEWIASLALDPTFKADVLYPWLTATIGCSRADAARVSARSILQTFALSFPENPVEGASTFNSRIGLQGNLQRLFDRTRARVRRNASVSSLDHGRDGWTVTTQNGSRGGYRFVVMNAPPHVSRSLLKREPHFAKVADVLGEYRYFSSRLLVHRDPVYVPTDRSYWTAYNAGVTMGECEGSAWVGALHDPLRSGAPLDLFKSWAMRRSADPERIVFQREFKHPLISPRTVAAARKLQRHQGRRGLYFSGSYTTGSDLQETALWSAMRVAEDLAPRSRKLVSLKKRMEAKGIAGVSYDL